MNGFRPTVYCAAFWFAAYGVLLALGHDALEGIHQPVVMFAVAFLGLSSCVVGAAWCANRPGTASPTWVQTLSYLLGSVLLISLWPDVPGLAPVHGFTLLWGCCLFGRLLGQRWRDPAHLWPLVIVAMSFDLWSVFATHGLTNQIVESAQAPDAPLLHPLMLTMPIPGFELSPLLGVGDLLFAGFIVGGASTLGLSQSRVLSGLMIGLFITLFALLLFAIPIPALPIIGPSMAIALGTSVRPRLRDVSGAVIFILFGLALLNGVLAFN